MIKTCNWTNWLHDDLHRWNEKQGYNGPWRFRLPWPPSVNHYWSMNGRGMYITAKGKRFRQDVAAVLGYQGVGTRIAYLNPGLQKQHDEARIFPLRGRVGLQIYACPPDRRKRDLDNLAKALFDAMSLAGVFHDDFQIDSFSMRRLDPTKSGLVCVEVVSLER